MKKITSQEIKAFVSRPLFDEKVILNKDPSWPMISIVTPSYNQAQFLERTILSVLNQNYPNLEYIIIDGGSADGSVEIIKKYGKWLTYWVSEPDKGQSDAINKGFTIATGEIIGWQNSDDIYLPHAFLKIALLFSDNMYRDFVFGNIYMIDRMDNIIRDLRFVPFSYYSLIYEGTVICNQSAFWRNSLTAKSGFLDTNYQYSMDYEFWSRISKICKPYFSRDYFGCFRVQPKSKSNIKCETGYQEHFSVVYREGSIPTSNTYKLIKTLCNIRRFCFYLLQGDLDYVLNGIRQRLAQTVHRYL